MESSSCFVCGVNLIVKPSPLRIRCNSFKNLNELVSCLCELLSVEVTPEDWQGIDADYLMKQTIACEKCFDLLRNVEKVHQVILKAQRELEQFLEQVESLIVKSGSLRNCSLWRSSCYKLRRSIFERTNPAISDEPLDPSTIKEEDYRGNQTSATANFDDHFDDDHWDPSSLEEHPPTTFQKKADQPVIPLDSTSTSSITLPLATEADELLPPPSSTSPYIRKRKKRKITVIAEEDEAPPQTKLSQSHQERPGTSTGTGRPRTAKDSPEEAILQQKFYFHDDDDQVEDNQQDNDDTPYEENDPSFQSDASEDDEITTKKKFKAPPPPPKKKSKQAPKTDKPKPHFTKRTWWTMQVVADDLFLYRRDTFIRKTYTHLECLAYKCGFKTEFDYYPSFQIMREHLDENHRDYKHRQQTIHPCAMCNTLHKNREQLIKHLKTTHSDKFGKELIRAVCECCLKTILQPRLNQHLFTHKNSEEQAAAAATCPQDLPAKIQRKLAIVEGKLPHYPCPFPDCPRAFESPKGLRCHKQTHLPRHLRTDLALCPECGVEMSKESIAKHLIRIHHPETTDRPLICYICEKRYLSSDKHKLEAHIRRHKGENPYMCPTCGKQFPESNALCSHVRQVHGSSDPIPCQFCDRVYFKVPTWRIHMYRKHPDKISWNKRIAHKSKFYSDPEVKGPKYGPVQQFPCELCENICKFKQSLVRHMKNSHGIEMERVRQPRKVCRRDAGGGLNTKVFE